MKKSQIGMSILALAILTIGTISTATSVYASGNHGKMDHSKMKKNSRKVLDEKSKKEVFSMLEANEELHNAFFNYDGKNVESKAKALKTKMAGISNTSIAKLLKFAMGKLDSMKFSNTREDNNQHYHIVSMAMIYVINSYDVGGKYNAYSCPMEKKKWIQNSSKVSKVQNPYAKGMPGCGSRDTNHK